MTYCLTANGFSREDCPAPPTRMLAATADHVAILERATPKDPWRIVGRTMDGMHVSVLAVEPISGGLFAGVHRRGVWFSGDQGKTWEKRSSGITQPHIYTIEIAQTKSGPVIYAGSDPAALFRSDDMGKSWTELTTIRDVPGTDKWWFPPPPHHAHVKTIAVDPRNPDTLYVGVEQGALLKSVDGGKTWRELDHYSKPDDEAYKDIHQLFVMADNPDEIYCTFGVGLYHSRDAGETWARLTDRSFRIGYPDNLIVAPDRKTIFIAGSSGPPGSWRNSHYADGTVCRSRDGGKTWENLAGRGLPQTTRANVEAMGMACYPGGYTLFVGNTSGELYSSDDHGDSFTLVSKELRPFSKDFHYATLQEIPLDSRELQRKAREAAAAEQA